MKWVNFEKQYRNQYFSKYGSENTELLEKNLVYAKHLYEKNAPIIFDSEHFSLLVGYKISYLYRISNRKSGYYRDFRILKKNGIDYRRISEPLSDLKVIQRWILDNILSNIEISPYAKAYRRKYNLKDNARFHRNQDRIVKIDLKDFFNSISSNHVREVFKNLGYSKQLCELFTQLVVYKNSLAQGAPTSPAISNIIMLEADSKIGDYCMANSLRYTRYADDLTFSGSYNNVDVKMIISIVKSEVKKVGLNLNFDKIKVLSKGQRQIVTGIVVNSKMRVPREYTLNIRKEVHYIKKYGIESHLQKINWKGSKKSYLSSLIGKINYSLFINKNENLSEMLKYVSQLKNGSNDRNE